MNGPRKKTIIESSKYIEESLGIKFSGKEFNYGPGIGRADNFVQLNERTLCILEIESSQRHPEMNVLKIWPWIEMNTDKDIILVQYILNSSSVSPNRINLCKWIANKIEEASNNKFHYLLLLEKFEEHQKEKIIGQLKNIIR